MATRQVSPLALGFGPALGLSKKQFKLQCRKDARLVVNNELYGIYSHHLKAKIRPTVLSFPQGGVQTIPGGVHMFIVGHVKNLKLAKAVYFMVPTTATTMVESPETLSKQLADSLGRTIHVHKAHNGGYRFGELTDNEDLRSIAGYAFITESYPHPALVRARPYFGDDDSDDNSDHAAADTAATSTVEAYVHLKQIAEPAKAKNRGRRAKKNEIPKPQNAWVLFLNDNYHQVKAEQPHMRTTEISKVIAGMWKEAKGGEVQRKYNALAEEAKKEHFALYGDYKVKPRKSSEIKRRNVKKTKTVVNAQADLSPPDMHGVGVDVSEFRQDNFNISFAAEGSDTIASQEHVATVNHNASNLGYVADTTFGMSHQAIAGFASGPAYNSYMQGGFYYSAPAAEMSTAYNADLGDNMVGFNDGTVGNTFFEDVLESAIGLTDTTYVNGYDSLDLDLPGEHQFQELMQSLGNY